MGKRNYDSRKCRNERSDRMRSLTIHLLAGLILLGAGTDAIASQSSARDVAMGGAYTGLAEGVDAARKNPANLGLTDYRRTAVEVVGAGLNISNNSFTLSDYNEFSGKLLTDADKDYILSRIPNEGLKLSVNAEVGALSMARGQFAFSLTGVGVADVNLSKDIFDLVFNGNTFADTIDVTGSYSEGMSYVEAGLSYGRPIYNSGTRQLAIGGTVKYIRGIASEEIVKLEGIAATDTSGMYGEGQMVAHSATGGTGYGIDLGAALRLNEHYTVGLKLKNVLGSISWNQGAEEHGFDFSFDTTNIDNMSDDHVVSEDYSIEIDSYSTRLPAVLTIGFARHSGSVRWAIDWEQGLKRYAGASKKPRLAAGVELTKLRALPIRLGYAVGGDRNSAFSFGSGFHLMSFYLDYAVVTGSSLSGYSSKGLNLAISTGLQF